MEWIRSRDYMGMLHSYQRNGLQGALEDKGMLTRLQTALKIEAIAEPISKEEQYVTLRKVES
jgi:uridylate kinase